MTERKTGEEKPVCPSTKASNITLRRLALRVKILQNQARILVIRVRTRTKLMVQVLRLSPRVIYISYKPMIHPKLLRALARERGEDEGRFINRCWMETSMVQEEIGSFEGHAKRLGYVAKTNCTLEVRVDYDPPAETEAERKARFEAQQREREARLERRAQREAELAARQEEEKK